MNTNFTLSKEYKFNLRLLIKRCGLRYKDISTLLGESRQTVWNDLKGGKVSKNRLVCYERLPDFLEYAISNNVIFTKNKGETAAVASDRRYRFVLILKGKFLNSLMENMTNAP